MDRMTQPSRLDPTVWAHIEKDVSGQVIVGNHNAQIGSNYGVVVMPAPAQRPPQLRPPPIFLRPRAFPGLLDRQSEVASVTATLLAGDSAEFYGEEGAGKTTLLRTVAYHAATASFRDGVIFLRVGDQPAVDLLLVLFDAFYERDAAVKPTDGDIRHGLNDKRALILCDDVELSRDEIEMVMNVAPGCTFLLGSPDARLWGYGGSIGLTGLPPDEAFALLERELRRPLLPNERDAARTLCDAVGCRPLRLLQAAALARETGVSLAELAQRLRTAQPATVLVDEALPTLSESQRRILALLAAFGGRPVESNHLGAIAGVADPSPALTALELRHLVKANSPYRATGVSEAAWLGMDLLGLRALALDHFAAWAVASAREPARLAPDIDILVWLLRWADSAGRWRDVLRLGRAIDATLAISARWGAWERALGAVHRAAITLGDRTGEAWVLHQIGTRALCLGDLSTARAGLTEALRLREALGDRIGAAVTRHNLGFLLPPPGTPPTRDLPRPPTPPTREITRRSRPMAWIAAVMIAISLIGTGVFVLANDGAEKTPVAHIPETRTPRPTRTPKPARTPRPTRTPRLTRTPTTDPTAIPPTEIPPTEDKGGAAGITPEITEAPATPVDVAVTLFVDVPTFLSDGRINLPLSAFVSPEGDYALIVQAIDEQQPIGQSNGIEPIVLGFEQYGKKIIVRAMVDVAEDADFSNNSAEQIVELPWPADLVPISCRGSDGPPTVVIENQGQYATGPFTTRLFSSEGDFVDLETGSIEPNSSGQINFESMPPSEGLYTVIVDATDVVKESNENNNGPFTCQINRVD